MDQNRLYSSSDDTRYDIPLRRISKMSKATEYAAIPSGDEEKGEMNEKHDKVFAKALYYLWGTGRNRWNIRMRVFSSIFFLVLSNLSTLVLPIILKMIIDDLSKHPPSFPWHLIILYGILRFSGTLLASIRDILFARVSAQTERAAALDIFKHLNELSLSYHLSRKTGSVVRSVSRGASSFALVLRIVLFQFIPVFARVVIVCAYLFLNYNWYFGVLTFGIIVVYVVYTWVTTDWRNKFRRTMNEKDNEYNQKAVDALLNFETVKYFNAEEHERVRYDKALKEYREASILSQQTLAILNCGQDVTISAGIATAMILAGELVVHSNDFSVGDFVLIQQFILTLYEPLGFLGTYYRTLKQSIIDIESMMKIMNERITVKDFPNAPELSFSKGKIEFRNVFFSYSPEVPIIRGISFTVEPGQSVAIVGSSGAGKSTIGRLLYRFYDIQSGQILVDGQDISSVKQKSLRKNIGIVPQDCVLFNDSIGYNIAYGIYARKPEGASKAEIEEAARNASVLDFIQSLPLGFDTFVGERGLRLSGGEKQRVAIARALLKNPGIMIFDEATSSLDSATEIEIQKSLKTISKGRSTLTIAHRLSTIVDCDKIIVIDQGQIIEQGSHDQLVKLDGAYAKLWEKQNRIVQLKETLRLLQ